jgi:hypothetical protein
MIHEQISFVYSPRINGPNGPLGFCPLDKGPFENHPHFAPTLTIPYRSKLFFLGASRSALCLLVSIN